MAITPTSSSAGIKVYTIGVGNHPITGAPFDFADPYAFSRVSFSYSAVGNSSMVIGEVYQSYDLTGKNIEIAGGSANANFFYVLRPVPGLDQAFDGDNAPVTLANSGITFTFDSSSTAKSESGLRFHNANIKLTGTNTGDVTCIKTNNDFNTNVKFGFDRCRVSVELAGTRAIFTGDNTSSFYIANSLVVFAANCSASLFATYFADVLEDGNTYIRLGATGFIGKHDVRGGYIRNCAYKGVGGAAYSSYSDTSYLNNITDNAADTRSGFTVVASDTMFAAADDYRIKTNGSLYKAGNSGSANTLDLFRKSRGLDPSVGAIQRDYLPGAPQGTVTNTAVTTTTGNKRRVTISGTTTGTPTSGRASITPTTLAGNHAVAQLNVVMTLGNGTFTVSFDDAKVGQYSKTITLSNAVSISSVVDNTLLNVTGATGVITSQPAPSGQLQSVSGTTTGSPDSGTITWPANTTAADTNNQGPFALTLGTGTFSDNNRYLAPGTYDAPVYDFTTAAGTSISSSSGGLPVIINGIMNMPQAPETGGTTNPDPTPVSTVTGVTVTPEGATITGGTSLQFSGSVQGTNSPSQGLTWIKVSGVGSINASGAVTAPTTTNVSQTGVFKATSTQDGNFSKEFTITVPAATSTGTAPVLTLVNRRLKLSANAKG